VYQLEISGRMLVMAYLRNSTLLYTPLLFLQWLHWTEYLSTCPANQCF